MKTLVLKANDIVVERLISLVELFPDDQYELSVFPEKPAPISLERGSGKTLITSIADDFDESLEDFKDYMS